MLDIGDEQSNEICFKQQLIFGIPEVGALVNKLLHYIWWIVLFQHNLGNLTIPYEKHGLFDQF